MTHVEHIAFWVNDIETIAAFYAKYFHASVGPKYENDATGFSSRFLYFSTGARMELMAAPSIQSNPTAAQSTLTGFAHIAISTGADQHVEELTDVLRRDGHRVVAEPRRTGDGYYESIVLDPEGNRVEITA
jgi:lactoylglutathione lyase